MSGGGAARDATLRTGGVAVGCAVISTSTDSAYLWTGTFGANVAILLAPVATDGLADVLAYGNFVSEDKNALLKQVVS